MFRRALLPCGPVFLGRTGMVQAGPGTATLPPW
jgi:hypothetical protein